MEIKKELKQKVMDGIIKLITTDREIMDEIRKEAGDDFKTYLALRQAYYNQVVECFTKYKDAFKKQVKTPEDS